MSDLDRFDQRIADIIAEIEQRGSMLGLSRGKAYRAAPSYDLSVLRPARAIETPMGVAGGERELRFEDWLRFWYHGARTLEFDTEAAGDTLEASSEEFAAAIALVRRLQRVVLPDRDPPAPAVQVQFRLDTRGPGVRVAKGSVPSMEERMASLRDQGRDWRNLGLDCLVVRPLMTGSPDETETLARIILREMDVEVVLELDPTLLGREEVTAVLATLPGAPSVRPDAFEGAMDLQEILGTIRRLGSYATRGAHRFSIRIGGTLATEQGPLRGRPQYLLGLRLLEKIRANLGPEIPVGFAADPEPEDVVHLAAAHVAPVMVPAAALGSTGAARISGALRALEERMRQRGVRSYPDYVLTAGAWGRDALNQALGEVSEAFRDARADWPADVREEVRRATDEIGAEMLLNLESVEVDLQRVLREGIAWLRQRLSHLEGLPVVEDHLDRLARVRLRARDLAGSLGTPEIVAVARSVAFAANR